MTRMLALDLGTTSFKAVVYDERGEKLAEQRADPPDQRVEIDGVPVDIWEPQRLWAVIADLLSRTVADWEGAVDAIAIAQLGLIGVPLDAEDRPLYPFVTWIDASAGTAAVLARSGLTDFGLYEIAGNRLNSIYPPAWIGWMSDHEPRFADGMARWVFVGDWLAYRLAGVLTSDYSITSQALVLDQTTLELRRDLLSGFGLAEDLFPAPEQAGRVIGTVTAQAAAVTGLREDVRVVLGGADWLIGVFGCGLTEPGDAGILTGTWENTFTCAREPCLTELACTSGAICDPHVAPGRWALRIEALSGEVSEWCRHQLQSAGNGEVRDWAAIIADSESVVPGSGGIVFVPHLLGSYGPRHDELARGAFIGLTGASTRAAMTRAVFEGLSFQTRSALEALTAATGVDAERVLVMGGGVKNTMWLQARANALGRSVEVVEDPDVTPRGAAMLAGIGLGLFSDFHDAVDRLAPPTRRVDPEPATARLYERLYEDVYTPLQDALAPVNHRLARLGEKGGAS